VRSHARAVTAPSTHRQNSGTFSLGILAAMLACAAAFLGIGAPAASAAAEAQPAWAFAYDASAQDESFESSRNPLAVDSQERPFVVDQLTGIRVLEPGGFRNSKGDYVTQFNPGFASSIAIDTSTDAVYVQELGIFGGTVVKRFVSDGKDPPTYTEDPSFSVPLGDTIAVDPTTGNLLVADSGAEAVRRYNASGTLIDTISTPSINPSWLTALPDGSFLVAPAFGPDVTHFSGSGTVLGTIPNVGALRGLAYDPVRNVIVTLVGNSELVNYSLTGSRLSVTPRHGDEGGSGGLLVDPSGRLFVPGGGAGLIVFIPAVQPGVEPPTVSAITPTSLHVETEVDPGGVAETSMHFEYRAEGAATEDNENWIETPEQDVSAAGSFGADLTGLEANRTYEVRAVASNPLFSYMTTVTTASTTKLPPAVVTGAATDLRENSVVLNGTINAYGLPTTYHFEYGLTAAYGSRVPVGIDSVGGASHGVRRFNRTIRGLAPGTTYHVRLVATNSEGTTEGLDRTFTTIAAGGIPHRAYEQVTEPEKNGAAIIPRVGMLARPSGDAIAYTTKTGAETTPLVARSIAFRGSSDWQGRVETDPPTNPPATGGLFQSATLAISDDFTHAFVVTNRALTPGAIEGGGNLYVRDVASRAYTFVASTDDPDGFNSFSGAKKQGRFLAGASDFSWVLFNSRFPLLPGAPGDAMYYWSRAGGLEVESTLPDGDMTTALHASQNSPLYLSSEDGSRIYYTALSGSEEGVFLREDGGSPKAVSVSQVPGDPATPQPAVLLGVNKDGRYAFLGSYVRLTSDGPSGSSFDQSQGLYRYDAVDGTLEYLGAKAVVRVSAGENQTGSFGIGADGNTMYFEGESDNVSVWRDGVVHQVIPTGLAVGFQHPSPNGRYFAFNGDVGGQFGPVYLYDAVADQVTCVSCLPEGTPAPASLPLGGEVLLSNKNPAAVLDDGTVYFDTAARLVAADVNGTTDVYSFREGTPELVSPGNRPFDAIYADASADGKDVFFTTQQKLVGRDNDESIDIYDARVNGGLPAQSPPPPQECLRDDCKATPNAGPELPFGGSEALNGPENVKPAQHKKCGKGKRAKKTKGKVRCVSKHKVEKHKANKGRKGGNR
jgi:hypothetical protein